MINLKLRLSTIKKITDLLRGLSDFKKVCQPRINTVKDKKGDLVTDCNSILVECLSRVPLMLSWLLRS